MKQCAKPVWPISVEIVSHLTLLLMEDLATLPQKWINLANNLMLNSTYGYRLRPDDLLETYDWLVKNTELVASRGARIVFNKQFKRIDDTPADKPHRLLLQFLPTPNSNSSYSIEAFQLSRDQNLEFHNSPIFQPGFPYLTPLDLRQQENMPKPKRVTNSIKWVPGDNLEGDPKEPGLKYYDEPPEYDEQGVIQNYPGKNHDLSCFWVVEVVKWIPEAKTRSTNYPSVFNTKGLVAKWPRKGHAYKILKDGTYYYGIVFGQQVMCGDEGKDHVTHITSAAHSLDSNIKTGPKAQNQIFDEGFEGMPTRAQTQPNTSKVTTKSTKPLVPRVADDGEEEAPTFSATACMPTGADSSKSAQVQTSLFGLHNTGGESSKPPTLPSRKPSPKGKEIAHDWKAPAKPPADAVSEVSSKKRRLKSRSPTPQLLLPEATIPRIQDSTEDDAMELADNSLRLFVRLNNGVTELTGKHARHEASGEDIDALATMQRELSVVYNDYRGKLKELRR